MHRLRVANPVAGRGRPPSGESLYDRLSADYADISARAIVDALRRAEDSPGADVGRAEVMAREALDVVRTRRVAASDRVGLPAQRTA